MSWLNQPEKQAPVDEQPINNPQPEMLPVEEMKPPLRLDAAAGENVENNRDGAHHHLRMHHIVCSFQKAVSMGETDRG